MTFELSAVHGIRCTLVDPRPLKLSKQQHKHLGRAGAAAVLTSWSAEQLQQGCMTAQQLPLKQQRQQQQPEQQQQQQQQVLQGPDALVQLHQQDEQQQQQQVVQLQQVQGWFGPDLWRSSGWQQLFGSSSSRFSLVIGLHPDEATEPIVGFALEAGLPFAVVPCCVFPRLFPHRRLDVGGGQVVAVKGYAQLVQYLMQKGGAGREVLGFVGANVVVFRQAAAG
jgi:hypothetical protein